MEIFSIFMKKLKHKFHDFCDESKWKVQQFFVPNGNFCDLCGKYQILRFLYNCEFRGIANFVENCGMHATHVYLDFSNFVKMEKGASFAIFCNKQKIVVIILAIFELNVKFHNFEFRRKLLIYGKVKLSIFSPKSLPF